MPIRPIENLESHFPYKELLLTLIIIKFIFENYLLYRQYKRKNKNDEIPNELKDLHLDEEKYKQSRLYSIAKMKFKFIEESFSLIIETVLIIFNYNPFLWESCQILIGKVGFNNHSEYLCGTVFIIIETIREQIYSIPFEIYHTFVLEENFGFNKTTMKTFISDIIKGLMLKFIFFPLIYSIIIKVIIMGGKYFYIVAEIACLVILFLFLWIYPNFIQPLFNKYTEIEEGDLKNRIFKLAERLNYPLKKIYSVDESKRSAHSNAYLFGFWKNKRIVLFDTLIKKLKSEEIESTLGHELGHWSLNHFIYNMIFVIIYVFFMLYSFKFYINNEEIFVSFGFKDYSLFIGLQLYFSIFSLLTYGIDVLQLKLTRMFEYQADLFSCKLGYGNLLVSSLKKLNDENLSDIDPDPLYSQFKHTHPTLVERIRAINEYEMKNKKEE